MSTVQTPLSRLFFNSRYLAGEELSDDESDQESDDEDDDEDPDNFEDTLDDSDNHQQQGSKWTIYGQSCTTALDSSKTTASQIYFQNMETRSKSLLPIKTKLLL